MKHKQQSEHKSSCARAVGLIATHRGVTHTVHQHIVAHNQTQFAENVEKLTSLLRTIEFCGRQNISLRGHREAGFSMDPNDDMQHDPVNFLALLRFRVGAGGGCLLRNFHKTKSGRARTLPISVQLFRMN